MGKHLLCSFKIGHDAVEHRRDHGDTARFAAVLLSCFATDVDHVAAGSIDCNERRFVNNHTAPSHRNDRRRRSHVYPHESHTQIKPQKGTKSTKES